MKFFKSLLALFVLLFFTTHISAKGKYKWVEKDEFHTIMSQTFHPAEEGNYAPIRSRIDELETKAIAFKNSKIPDYLGNKSKIKKNLKKLVKQSKAFNKKIKSGATDEELKQDFINLHETFHEIVGLCNTESEHNH